MPKKKSDSPVVYETANRELKTKKDYFARIGKPVIGIEWEGNITVGAEVGKGQRLAHLVWDDGTKTPMDAPSNCTGRIEWKNGQVEYEWLHLEPQVVLRLGAAAQRRLVRKGPRKRKG